MRTVTVSQVAESFSVSFLEDGGELHVRTYSMNLATDRKYMLNDIEAWLRVGESPRF